ncbi:MAG: Fe-S-containing protein [Helicobacteraceae bacterium]|jgi:uncharacterized membrane protein|nr:Fe-S-containing protein [Helicobacteraceae bacterium]
MLEYLINVTDTLFFTLVLIAILISGFTENQKGRRKSAAIAAALGFITALTIAILRYNTKLITREYYDLIVLIPLIITQIVFMFFMFFRLRFKWADTIVSICLPIMLYLLLAYSLVDIFLYPSEFAVGMDNIYNEDFALKWFGYVLALSTLFILHYSVYHSSLGASRKIFMPLASAILALVMIHELLMAFSALINRNFIDRKAHEALVERLFFISDHIDWLFYFACLATAAVAATLFVVENRKIFIVAQKGAANRDPLYAAASARGIISAPNPAIRRKLIAESNSKRRFYILTTISLFAAALFAKGGSYLAEMEVQITPPIEITAENGVITLPLEQFDDGRLKRFAYKNANGVEIRFLVIKKRGGYGVGLDACEICGVAGYYEEDDKVICAKCGVAINKATIGFRGGCNPIPFAYEITNSTLRIFTKTLDEEEKRFR